MIKSVCDNCNIEFQPKKKTAGKFCSLLCSRIHQKKHLKTKTSFVCGNCPNTFFRSPSQVKKSKNGILFCSRKCMAIFNNKHCISLINSKLKKKDRVCQFCGNIYTRFLTAGGKRCETCYALYIEDKKNFSYWNELTLGEFYLRHPKLTKFQARNKISDICRNQHAVLKNTPCKNCGYQTHVEFCHIKPKASFSEDSKVGDINSIENIIMLCPNCHWEFDNGKLILDKMKI